MPELPTPEEQPKLGIPIPFLVETPALVRDPLPKFKEQKGGRIDFLEKKYYKRSFFAFIQKCIRNRNTIYMDLFVLCVVMFVIKQSKICITPLLDVEFNSISNVAVL